MKLKGRLDTRDTLVTMRYVLYHQGEPDTGDTPVPRFQGFTQKSGYDWGSAVKVSSDKIARIIGNSNMRLLTDEDSIPLKVFHCSEARFIGTIMLPPSEQTASRPGGLRPGGTGCKSRRAHVHTARHSNEDFRSSRGCRDLEVQIEINARKAARMGIPV